MDLVSHKFNISCHRETYRDGEVLLCSACVAADMSHAEAVIKGRKFWVLARSTEQFTKGM